MDNPEKEEIQYKKCNWCGQVKPIRKFGRRKNSKDGYQYYCKRCKNKSQRAYKRGKDAKKKDYNAKILYDMMIKNGIAEIDGSHKAIFARYFKALNIPKRDINSVMAQILKSVEGKKYFEDNGYVMKTVSYTRRYKSIKIKDQKE